MSLSPNDWYFLVGLLTAAAYITYAIDQSAKAAMSMYREWLESLF